ncbi:MAG TPA: 3-phosphoserine/phosphohydroxythreonine transaminase [Spirochaetota bacterium]|mgnify:FL=1|nr:3-phosphoserine/phosphohydroxythreonine transaminase [Spirochaetota bacterium]
MLRVFNFAAGPSTLSMTVLEEAASELVDYRGTGMSLIEMSHRGAHYDAVHREAVSLVRELLMVPPEFHVLFLQGGATMQFAMVPLAFLGGGRTADYIITGHWARRAHADASVVGDARAVWDGSGEGYSRIPSVEEIPFRKEAAYVHMCSNETIGGIQWRDFPDTGGPHLVIDMSSDVLSRPLPWARISMLYAGTQKNLAPAGMTLVIMRDDLLARARRDLPAYLRYDIHADNDSLFNTPPTFIVWVMMLTLRWVKSIGGLPEIERRRDARAAAVYGAIDGSGGFFRTPVERSSRSTMNIVWTLADARLDREFLEGAEREKMYGLKGHKSVGGFRASLYNAMPVEGAEALAAYMRRFAALNG